MQSIKSKGRIGTRRSSAVQTWNQCTTATCPGRHTQTIPCMCKELGNAALCDPSRSRLFSIKFLGNPHQRGSIRSHFINALRLWEAREKPRLKEAPLAGVAGRIPHGSPSTGSLMLQMLSVKRVATGWAGEMFTSCCLTTHTSQESAVELLLHLASIQSPHQGENTPCWTWASSPPETGFLPCKSARPWQNQICSIIKEELPKSAISQVGQGCLICFVLFLEQVVGIPGTTRTLPVQYLLWWKDLTPFFFLSWSVLFGFNS